MQRRREAAGVAALGLAVALGISACGVSQQQEVQIGPAGIGADQRAASASFRTRSINQYVNVLGNSDRAADVTRAISLALLRREHGRRQRVRAAWRLSST